MNYQYFKQKFYFILTNLIVTRDCPIYLSIKTRQLLFDKLTFIFYICFKPS